MKSKLFVLLSLALVFTLIAPMSGSTYDVDASFIGNDDLPNSGYTISGKVTDANGNDISGITITASRTVKIYIPLVLRENNDTSQVKKTVVEKIDQRESNHQINSNYSTQSDVNGNYSLTGLPFGEYDLVASQSGYSFNPINYTITLPPSTDSHNFTRQGGTPPEGMLEIAASEFQMGCAPAHNGGVYPCDSDEEPLHSVYLDTYYIDKYEVANSQYAQCVTAGPCSAPSNTSSYTRPSYYGNPTYANYPVIYVNWDQSREYCEWHDKRLPTEAEWEKAARGTSLRAYPWDDSAPTCVLANFWGSSPCEGDTAQVGSYPSGASPYGVLDMAGNVWEWVTDWLLSSYYSSSPYSNPPGPETGTFRVLRGGSWDYNDYSLRVATRGDNNPYYSDFSNGFRCAVSAPGD